MIIRDRSSQRSTIFRGIFYFANCTPAATNSPASQLSLTLFRSMVRWVLRFNRQWVSFEMKMKFKRNLIFGRFVLSQRNVSVPASNFIFFLSSLRVSSFIKSEIRMATRSHQDHCPRCPRRPQRTLRWLVWRPRPP